MTKPSKIEKLLLIGPIDQRNRRIGGLTVSFNAYRKFLEKKRVQYRVIDTRPFDGGGGLFISLINLIIQALIQIPRHNVVFVYSSYNGFLYLYPAIYFFCKVFRARFCFYPNGGDLLDVYYSRPRWHRTLLRNTLFKSDVVFLQTINLMNRFKVFGANTVWFPSGRARPIGIKKAQVYSRRFIFLSRISREKGIEIIKETLEKLDESFTVHIYGPIGEKTIEKSIKKWGNYKGVVSPPHVLDILSRYDVLILPTFYPREGYPGIIIEAYSLGMPVIATDWMAIPEIVQDGVSGILVEPRSSLALANAMRSIDQDSYDRLCAGARNMFTQFDSDLTYEQVFNEILR